MLAFLYKEVIKMDAEENIMLFLLASEEIKCLIEEILEDTQSLIEPPSEPL